MTGLILNADARHIPLPDESVHCVVTSPPYWGLRDYKLAPGVWGGEAGCQHEWRENARTIDNNNGNASYTAKLAFNRGSRYSRLSCAFCSRCSAWRGVLGLEPTPELYVAHIVEVFREVWRVLRRDGTCWLNLGDSYAGTASGGFRPGAGRADGAVDDRGQRNRNGNTCPPGLKPKDLCGIPWRVAFALQADGWYLRSDIIWSKPNPMPESVTDRPTKAHEYVFLLAKSERYFYDALAIAEPSVYPGDNRVERTDNTQIFGRGSTGSRKTRGQPTNLTRNKRTVWTIATQPFPEAHFATFPEELAATCIKAGTSQRGCCPKCGAGWERVVERKFYGDKLGALRTLEKGYTRNSLGGQKFYDTEYEPPQTTGWQPGCQCKAGEPVPCTVLDPFAGSGTVGKVAFLLSRRFVCLDLKLDYCKMAQRRVPPGVRT